MKAFPRFLIGLAAAAALSATPVQAEPKRHRKGTVPIPDDLKKGPVSTGKKPATPTLHPTTKQAPLTAAERARQSGGDGGASGTSKEGASAGMPGGAALGAGADCSQKFSIETFMKINAATQPQAAKPGGVYFVSDVPETPQLFHQKSADSSPEPLTSFPDGVVYFRVSPDGQKVLVASHVGGDEQYDIYLVDAAKKTVTPLLVDRAVRVESVAWGPDGSWFVFTSNARNRIDMDLYRFDLAENKSTLLAELAGQNAVTDVSPNGKRVAIDNFRSVTDSDVLIWEMDKKELLNLTKHTGLGSNQDARFSADSQGVFYLSDVTAGVRQLYFLKIGAKAPGKPFTSEKWEVEAIAVDETRTSLGYLVNEEGYSRIAGFVVDAHGRKTSNLPVPKEHGGIARSLSFGFGPAKRSFFYSFTSSVRTPDVWLWEDPRLTQWTRSQSIAPDCLVREELVRYESFDKLSVPAFLYRPRSPQGAVPFIVFVHGGPESQYRPTFGKTFQYFLQRGFGILATNIRGSTGYGRDYTMLDNYRKRMDSVQDVIEGAKWLLTKDHSRPGKLAIYGGSYGGFLVLRSLQVEPELFSAGAESVGITDFVSFLKNTKPYRRALREAEYGPLSDVEFLKSISPMTYLDRIKTPLLIFHGANDSRVPVSETEQIVAALKKRDIAVESKIFADEGHGNTKLRNILEQARLMAYFFEKHIAREPAAAQ